MIFWLRGLVVLVLASGLFVAPVTTQAQTASVAIDKIPDMQEVAAGSTASFSIVVVNTGEVDLGGLSVADPLVPACNNSIPSLAPGASVSYSCFTTVTASLLCGAIAHGTGGP